MATPFSTKTPQAPGISRNVLLVAAGAVLLLVAVLAVATLHRAPKDSGGPDAYAPSLSIGNVHLSEATQGTGGKVTYVDGTVKNSGTKTLKAATVQLRFPVEDGTLSPPQTAPLTLVRTREPYVDLEPIAAEPLRPGVSHDFRIILEQVPAGWNTQPPQIHVVRTATE